MLVFRFFSPAYHPRISYRNGRSIPLLDLVEALEERGRDEDEDCLLAVADLDLYQNQSEHVHVETIHRRIAIT